MKPENRETIAIEQIIYEPDSLPQLGELFSNTIECLDQIERLQEVLNKRGLSQRNPYKAFYPMVQIKGFFSKLHKSRLVKSTKLITLNPIEGVLATYTCCKNIPHKPKDVIHLDDI